MSYWSKLTMNNEIKGELTGLIKINQDIQRVKALVSVTDDNTQVYDNE